MDRENEKLYRSRETSRKSQLVDNGLVSKDDELSNATVTPPTQSRNTIKSKIFVIQKYLERPLLIKKRKFDIRLWVLVTHDMKCFLFKEGYIRMSSREYTLDA